MQTERARFAPTYTHGGRGLYSFPHHLPHPVVLLGSASTVSGQKDQAPAVDLRGFRVQVFRESPVLSRWTRLDSISAPQGLDVTSPVRTHCQDTVCDAVSLTTSLL